ncbi:hypothetical protein PC116_g5882 [Phytophthora cactorum]|nr:hypothetical protein C6341_g3847 [Phytophthora cactorum]KAG4246322.1 hypothetical protein PC116_g5882 [Phytophthora cactorum]
MLDEGDNILRGEMKLGGKHVRSVIVPYYNGFSPQPVEKRMPIQAYFSRRLL